MNTQKVPHPEKRQPRVLRPRSILSIPLLSAPHLCGKKVTTCKVYKLKQTYLKQSSFHCGINEIYQVFLSMQCIYLSWDIFFNILYHCDYVIVDYNTVEMTIAFQRMVR